MTDAELMKKMAEALRGVVNATGLESENAGKLAAVRALDAYDRHMKERAGDAG